jgi:tRNA nucleotidyltransferase/poly(A) polymerase
MSLDPDKQKKFAIDVVRTLRSHGYEAYWAGGCVRDRLLGKAPKDYDVATTASPDEIRVVFSKKRTVPIGAQFGVITVIGPKPAGQIEVATFREDVNYSDGRRPDAVEFSTPEADAHRRDFTINGLFYDPLEDRIIDYVGGVADLGRGIVRAIGEPRARFEEDKLRLLRAVRFTATYDFALDIPTREAIEAMASQIGVVSVERIADEMRRMLTDGSRAKAVDLLHDTDLLPQILPELIAANDAGVVTVTGIRGDAAWLAVLETMNLLKGPSFPLALAALLVPFVDLTGAKKIASRWKLSNHESRMLGWLIEQQVALAGAEQMPWSRLQPLLIHDGAGDLVALHAALAEVRVAGRPRASVGDLRFCRRMLSSPGEELNPPPLLTGDDLIRLGIPRGKIYQRLLQAQRDAQLDGVVETKAGAIELVKQLLKEMS